MAAFFWIHFCYSCFVQRKILILRICTGYLLKKIHIADVPPALGFMAVHLNVFQIMNQKQIVHIQA